jgi:hypothetical protein
LLQPPLCGFSRRAAENSQGCANSPGHRRKDITHAIITEVAI